MFLHRIDDELSLKLPEHRDAEKLFALIDESREHLRAWLGWLDGTTGVEDVRGWDSTRSSLRRLSGTVEAALCPNGWASCRKAR